MSEVAVAVMRLPHGQGLKLPERASPGAAGVDLLAAVQGDLRLAPGERALVPTGIAIALPAGWEAQVRPRSGLALTHGVTVLNAPGTIDADYRGEVAVVLVNLGQEPVTISRGMRIAQLVLSAHGTIGWREAGELAPTRRGGGGFGSTGTGG